MTDLFAPSIDELVKEAERETALRRSVYPGLVAKCRMKADMAERRISNMEAIAQVLRGIAANASRVKADDATMTEAIRAQIEVATLQSWPVDIEPIRR